MDSITERFSYLQNRSFADVLQNRLSLKFNKFHRKTLVLKSIFNKFAGVIKRRLIQHMCFLLKSGTFLKTAFFIEHIRWVLLCLPPFSCISYQKTWTDFSHNFHKNPKLFQLELKKLNRKKDQKNLQIVKFLLFFFTDNYTLFGT